jgi:gluconate 5-dehydrogenase
MAGALAAAGAHVVLTARNADALAARKAEMDAAGLSCEVAAFDVADPPAARAAVADTAARHGRLDIIVSNVARSVRKPLMEQTEEEWQGVLDTALTAGWRLAHQAAPVMARNGWGRMIFVSSINARIVRPHVSAYAAAKAALEGLVRSLAVELAPSGITANAIAPGYFLTDGNAALRAERPEFEGRISGRIPAGRWGSPDELATTALYLASPASSYTTGSVLVVDGGMTVMI